MPSLPTPLAPPHRLEFVVLQNANETVALTLWEALRKVNIWAETEPEKRGRLFSRINAEVRARFASGADAVPLLADPLAVLERLQAKPGQAEPREVGRACDRISDWAARSGLLATATHFAEAAAYADPDDPGLAAHAGYMTRIVGGPEMLARSDSWYRRAYALAVNQHNREESVRALTGLGALLKDLGEYERARAIYSKAARRALRTGRRRRAAIAMHYSFALCAETDDVESAIGDADAALSYYPLHDERFPALVHDFAYLLIRKAHYRTALSLVGKLGDRVEGVWAMGMFFGITARAAAGAGRKRRARSAARAALNVALINEQCAAPVFVNLAEASRLLGRFAEAGTFANRALAALERRPDLAVERLALELVAAIRRQEPPSPCVEPDPSTPIAVLSRRLAARIRRWRTFKRGTGVLA